MKAEVASKDSLHKPVNPALKIWFIFHVVMIWLWSMPMAPPEVRNGARPPQGIENAFLTNDRGTRQSPIGLYMLSTGLWQYWDMFAPNPLSTDFYIDAAVEMADGTLRQGTYPRISQLSLVDRYSHERFRKYVERASRAENQYLWPQFAHRIAYWEAKDPNNLPVRVTLLRYYRQVGPPGQDPKPWSYELDPYFVWVVNPAQLKKDKGWEK